MTSAEPNAAIIWDNINAYQRTACLKGAVELGVFTRIGEGARTAEEISAKCGASTRGIRILCDYLTVQGLLTKNDAADSTPHKDAYLAYSTVPTPQFDRRPTSERRNPRVSVSALSVCFWRAVSDCTRSGQR